MPWDHRHGQEILPLPEESETEQPHPTSRTWPATLTETLERRRVSTISENRNGNVPVQGELQHIGEEVSERLEYVPASLYVIEEACQKYACGKGCTVVTAQKPMQPIEKGLPGPGLLAHVAVSKYGDHLPLYRQEGIYQRQGVAVSRKTMCDWMRRCAELVRPLFERMKEQFSSPKPADGRHTGAVLDPALPRTRTGRIWTYVGDDEHPYTVYDYTPNRSRDGRMLPERVQWFLQADAYSGYDQLYKDPARDVTEVACWAHARRRFYEAQSSDLMRSTVMWPTSGCCTTWSAKLGT